MKKRKIPISEEKYATAAKNGIGRKTLYSRIDRLGWDIERAATEPIVKSKSPLTKKDYETAVKNGISKEVVYARVYLNHWSVKRAINTPVKHRNVILTDAECAIAAENGISKRTAQNRVKKLKWSIKEAITKPVNRAESGKIISSRIKIYAVYKGEELLVIGTAKECGEELGLSHKTIHYYASGAYKEKLERSLNKGINARVAVVIDEDDE